MNMLSYSDCCSKLEKIASKKRIYGSESTLRLNKKGAKLNGSVENVLKEVKEKNNRIPFICAGSANKSHHIGINIQLTMSIMKQFPGQNYEQNYSTNGSSNLLTDSKLNKNSRLSISQNDSEMKICPARSEEKFSTSENNIFNEIDLNPWSVKQFEGDTHNMFECWQQKNSCSCSTRCMDSYYKVMAPFMKHLRHKKKLMGTVQNPYTKARVAQYYGSLSRCVQDLKLAMITMNNGFVILTEKYKRLYEQHVRNPDGNLIPILLQTEDELKILKSKVEEAVNSYKEAVNTQQSEYSTNMLPNIETDKEQKPKETNNVRLAKVLRRVQLLQEKLKAGHFLHGFGDQSP